MRARGIAVLVLAGVACGGCASSPAGPTEPEYARQETSETVRLALAETPDEHVRIFLDGSERRLVQMGEAARLRQWDHLASLARAYREVLEDGIRARLDRVSPDVRADVARVLSDHPHRLGLLDATTGTEEAREALSAAREAARTLADEAGSPDAS